MLSYEGFRAFAKGKQFCHISAARVNALLDEIATAHALIDLLVIAADDETKERARRVRARMRFRPKRKAR